MSLEVGVQEGRGGPSRVGGKVTEIERLLREGSGGNRDGGPLSTVEGRKDVLTLLLTITKSE